MAEIFDLIPIGLANFIIVLFLSLLIGLEQRFVHHGKEKPVFGTDRTFTFIGILGYILYILDENIVLFSIGAIALSILFTIYYYFKATAFEAYGLTSVLVGLITYCIGPLVVLFPPWHVLLIFVSVLMLVELKPAFTTLSKKFEREEFITLGKFLLLIGIILPIVPDERVIETIPVTAYQVWLALVIVSGISYLSYLLQKFVFNKAGLVVTAVLGGIYSSTATIFILAKKSRNMESNHAMFAASIMFATSMMFPRIFILALIFYRQLAQELLLPFTALFLFSLLTAFYWHSRGKKVNIPGIEKYQQNPLEIKIAVIFAILYLLLNIATHYSLEYYGTAGLHIVSVIVGLAALDPFLLNLFQTGFGLELNTIAQATLIAMASNNLVKGFYILLIAKDKAKKFSFFSLLAIFALNLLMILLFI